MPIDFSCALCGIKLGEMNKGRLKHESVLLCSNCWRRAKTAYDVAMHVRETTPDFLRDMLGSFNSYT